MKGILQPQYTELAEVYDTVMKNVDYVIWADFIDEIIQRHHPSPSDIMELACGTGSLSFALDRYRCYQQITGTDKSRRMIQKARQKAEERQSSVSFGVMDFLNIDIQQSFDIVVSIFDSVNYLRAPEEVLQMLEQVKKIMKRRYSLFIFDFTTPVNSVLAEKNLNDNKGITRDHYRFLRKSVYNEQTQIHYNNFEIEKLSEDHQYVLQRYSESHSQRIYSLTEMKRIIQKSEFNIKAAYSEFELNEATSESLRVTMVLTCPIIPL
jgi:ubiquinone/menaquinone biosynthesis C-methylase UbiE